MTAPARMKFGVFMAPFHRVGENPTLALERDLELLQWLDHLGYDEAWIGEHHSAGWETIASPEVFMATAAERTRNLRLGTGVVSLPYHPSLHGRQPHGSAGSPHPRARDAGGRPRRPGLRRLHVRHQPRPPARDDGRVPGGHQAADGQRRTLHLHQRLVRAPRRPSATAALSAALPAGGGLRAVAGRGDHGGQVRRRASSP